jgi:putative transposase
MNRAHQIRLDPTDEQAAYFRRACGVRRYTFNRVLAHRIAMKEAGTPVSNGEAKRWFNATKRRDCPFVLEVTKCASEQAVADVNTAYRNFFAKRTKFPRFARKGDRDRFYLDNQKFKVDGKRLWVAKLGWVRLREPLRFAGKLMSAVVREIAGHWYVSVSVEMPEATPVERPRKVCGVDLGIKDFATVSSGGKVRKIQGPRALSRRLKRLRLLNKRLARGEKGSRRRAKTKLALGKAHWKVRCVRNDFLHKLTTSLVQEYTHVVIEDLHVKGMSRNRRLARHILDQGWGEFRRQLEYKGPAAGTDIIVAGRYEPSSKRCRRCKAVNKHLKLSERKWACPRCGSVHDRDGNAAGNLEDLAGGSP